ncbi:Bax inhibitor-1/YccA family protein [Lewinella sp. IMCC34183]|uniref:Bax inhibitor-1/YccA family protein n=1 Tax=Lewinella sp. IMCC34183 TaxID=2248762 RepID=UPI000E22890B|nr:Bax inhibitor-1/YccA family protein [Lewinella sp. IMCC34183]
MSLSDRFSKSSNPLLSEERLAKASARPLDGGFIQRAEDNIMTVDGAVNKTFLLGVLLLATAVYSFFFPSQLFVWGGALGGLALVFVMAFKPKLSGTLAPIYALLEGLFVGSVTAIYAAGFGVGMVFNAILATIALLFMMLFIYKAGIITVNNKFRSGVMMATGAIFVVYLINMGLSFFGMNIPFLHSGGMLGIGISLVIIGVATLNLLLDFDNIERGAAMQSPKYMEWFCAMGLIVTLVWLYLEILRLLSVMSRD